MISRKGQKTIKEGVVGKYVKKDTPPEIPSKASILTFHYIPSVFKTFNTMKNCVNVDVYNV